MSEPVIELRGAPGETAGHANNFNLLRLVAACLVIVSHAYGLSHPAGYYDEAIILNSQGIGWAAVSVFFLISGYLIAKSTIRNANLLKFIQNRILRIYPGLIVCTIISVVGLGLVFRSSDFFSYIRSGETLRFAAGNATAILIQFALPGVFAENPYPGAVNGSLWTLPFELCCYAAAGVLLASGILKSPKARLAVFLILLGCYLGGAGLIALGQFPQSSTMHKLHRLAISFGLGMFYAYAENRFRVRAWQVVAATAAFALSCLSPILILRATTGTAALALAVFWAAFLQAPILARARFWPDWSYGVYIYAFPIQQLLRAFWPGMNLALHIALASVLVLIPAALSWRFVERPALRLKRAN